MAYKTTFVIEIWTSERLGEIRDPAVIGRIAAGRDSSVAAIGHVIAQDETPLTKTQSSELLVTLGQNPDEWG